MTISVLMYHAIYSGVSELENIPEEDRPYAISLDKFQKQLDSLKIKNINVLNSDVFNKVSLVDAKKHSVLLTFDDGHNSFFNYAFPELLKRSMAGIFFVTSELINDRSDFCSWEQLKRMSNEGMSIQSHGKTHKFISDLNSQDAELELLISKETIEENIGSLVNMISFPGGRYCKRDINCGMALGYELFFTSNEGVNEFKYIKKSRLIKRFALRNKTGLNEFLKLSTGNYFLIKKRIFINVFKNIVKKIIGNNFYHLIYKRRRIN